MYVSSSSSSSSFRLHHHLLLSRALSPSLSVSFQWEAELCWHVKVTDTQCKRVVLRSHLPFGVQNAMLYLQYAPVKNNCIEHTLLPTRLLVVVR